ncbi:MAG TPA: DUF4082 domain-containing protein [Candidatus Methylomirabilis sp.]|nr:DUF4082 domain-containing protein [Candidatus Methylomirabilis sp.]
MIKKIYIGLACFLAGLLMTMSAFAAISSPPTTNSSVISVNAIAFDQTGTHLASARNDGRVTLWDISNRSIISKIYDNSSLAITGLAFNPDGTILATSSRDSVLRLWDIKSNRLLKKLHGAGEAGWIMAVTYSPNGKIVATAGADTKVMLWNTDLMRLKVVLAGHKDIVRSVSFSPDSTILASSSDDGTVRIWNADNGRELRSLSVSSGAVNSVVFNPKGRNIATGSSDGSIKEWNVSTGKLVRTYISKGTGINGLAYSPDGTMLTGAGNDGTIRAWRIVDGRLIGTMIQGSGIAVRAIAYSPDSRIVASAGTDGVIKLWNAMTLKRISTDLVEQKVVGSSAIAESPAFAKASNYATANQGNAAALSQGPGGPILLITSSSSTNPFGSYYTEILRNEGFNAFQVSDISNVTSTTLSNYSIVILGEMALNSSQVQMLSDWVTGGGRLIAMRPDPQLGGLLGITGPSGMLNGSYLLINTTNVPGKGIVTQTIQYKGTADRYSLNGATSVATLYSNANTPTAYPAVTLRNVGSGQAAAFTYDLARSIVYMRQGNPAWDYNERDGFLPIRSDDLFYGALQPDWIDFEKVAIPQADEQQRLLANMIIEMTRNIKPLPRFWYLPRGIKAAIVMTGDDHANGGTAGRFDQYISLGPANCEAGNWECIRGTSYVYTDTPLSDTQALYYQNQGFEIGLHVNSNCGDYNTQGALESFYSGQLSSWRTKYSSITSPRTHRMHCVVWNGWSVQPSTELNNGIRFDTTYYYWPSAWLVNRPGFFTGSGMPMRFSDLNGSLVDVYQATTQMTDESGQSYPFTPNSLLDRAVGPEEDFGVFTVNAHTDVAFSSESDAVVSSALAHNIPIVSSRQMLDWIDGRDNSTYSNVSLNGTTLSFSVTPAAGSNGLQIMVPATTNAGSISSINVNGNPANYLIRTINGINYAFIGAVSGTFAIVYETNLTPPAITGISPASGAAEVKASTAVTATFSKALDATTINNGTFELHTGGSNGTIVPASVNYNDTEFVASLQPSNPLAYSTTYTAILKGGSTGVKDFAGNALATDYTWSFTTASGPICPCSIWNVSTIPWTSTQNDNGAVELGVKFRSDINGYITGIRFYKGPSNTGTHEGTLWSRNGTQLGRAIFSGETATGWQQANFTPPVAITAGTIYVASYHSDAGFYHGDNNYFTDSGVDNAPLHALKNGVDGGNGVYVYSPDSAFPSDTWSSTNYWVDVVFDTNGSSQDTTPPEVIGNTPASGATRVNVSTAISATFSEALNTTTINNDTFELHEGNATGAPVPANVSYNGANFVATLQPSNLLANSTNYTAIVKGGGTDPTVKDIAGNALAANYTWSFTTAGNGTCPCNIWPESATPAKITENDANAVELGVKFRSDVNGTVTGIRFYKGPSNTGIHVGSLWSGTGALLGNKTFTGETATGWQQVNFTTPVNITAGTTYVASYHTNVGYYSVDDNYFASSGVDNAPLHALNNSVSGGNGVYVYSANSAFPSNTYASSNYWIDIVFIS